MSSPTSPPGPSSASLVSHALKADLTVICGRTQLAQRRLHAGVPLSVAQVDQLLQELAIISAAASAMVPIIDAYDWPLAPD